MILEIIFFQIYIEHYQICLNDKLISMKKRHRLLINFMVYKW